MAVIPPSSLDAAGHLIQVALTPVFLLSGIAALLNVFAGRLARVADRLDKVSRDMQGSSMSDSHAAEIAALHRRSVLLDMAVVMATLGAAATCLAILALFFLGVSAVNVAVMLLFFFGAAIGCTLLSVALFGWELLISSHGVRKRMRVHLPGLRFLRKHPRS